MARAGRTQECSAAEARTRLAHAKKFFEVAELVADEDEIAESASVAAALAVLAGIAASDAASCARLRRRARGQDHHEAEALLSQIVPGGEDAARALSRLLDLKDAAHYGLMHLSGTDRKAALRHAQKMIRFAEDTLG